jgi:hypothetical protein
MLRDGHEIKATRSQTFRGAVLLSPTDHVRQSEDPAEGWWISPKVLGEKGATAYGLGEIVHFILLLSTGNSADVFRIHSQDHDFSVISSHTVFPNDRLQLFHSLQIDCSQ